MYIETFALDYKVTDKAVNLAFDLLPNLEVKPTPEEQKSALAKMSEKHNENLNLYEQLVDKLCDAIEGQNNLHWRHSNLALCMITTLTRYDRQLPTRAVNLMVNNLIHDNILV